MNFAVRVIILWILVVFLMIQCRSKNEIEKSHFHINKNYPPEICRINNFDVQVFAVENSVQKEIPITMQWENSCKNSANKNKNLILQYFESENPKRMQLEYEYREDGSCGTLAIYRVSNLINKNENLKRISECPQ